MVKKVLNDLPAGTVTLLFIDMEGSTRLLQQLGNRYPSVLADHRQLLRTAFERWHGHEVDTQGEPVWAARLWGAAQALRAVIGAPLPPAYRADYERALTILRTHLGEAAFATALAEGEAMALEQTLDGLPLLFSHLDEEAVTR